MSCKLGGRRCGRASACVCNSVKRPRPHGSISVGTLAGRRLHQRQETARSRTPAGTSYQSGIFFMVSIAENGSWRLGFAHESWRLTPGEAFPLALTFDGQPSFNVYGMPLGAQLVSVELPVELRRWSASFTRRRQMTAFARGSYFISAMNQTAQLLRRAASIAS